MSTRFSVVCSSPEDDVLKLSIFESSGDEIDDDDEDGDVFKNPEDEELQEENDDDHEELIRLDIDKEVQRVMDKENQEQGKAH